MLVHMFNLCADLEVAMFEVIQVSVEQLRMMIAREDNITALAGEPGFDYVRTCVNRMLNDLEDVESACRRRAGGGPAGQSLMPELVGKIQAVDDAADLLIMSLGQATPNDPKIAGNVSGAISWLNSTLKPWLSKVMGAAFNLLLRLLTPKEWKIKGGVASPFQSIANAELEITFG